MNISLKERQQQLADQHALIEKDLNTPPFSQYKEDREEFMAHPLGKLMGMMEHGGGPDLPDLPRAKSLTGDSHAEYVPKMEEFSRRMGYAVYYRPSPERGPEGETSMTWKTIFVRESTEPNGRLETLIHEDAHVLIAASGKRKWGVPREEVLVSSITALCLDSVGLDWRRESACYAAMYALQADGYADILTESRNIDLAHMVASRLEAALQS